MFDLARHQLAANIMKQAIDQAEARLTTFLETQISIVLEAPTGLRLIARIPETMDKIPDVRAYIHKLDQEDPVEMECWLFRRKNGNLATRKEERGLSALQCVSTRCFPEGSKFKAIFVVYSDKPSPFPSSASPTSSFSSSSPAPQAPPPVPDPVGPTEPVELLCYVGSELVGSVSDWKAQSSVTALRKLLNDEGVLDPAVLTYFLRDGKAISPKDEADPSLLSGFLAEREGDLWAVRLTTDALPAPARLEVVVSYDGNVVGYLELNETHQIKDIRALLLEYDLGVPPVGNKILRNLKGLKVPVADHAAKNLQGRDFVFTEVDTSFIYFQTSK